MRKRQIKLVDFPLIVTVATLSAFGLIAILAASHGKSVVEIQTTHIVLKQIIWVVVGFFAMIAMALFDYQLLRKYHLWLYGACIMLLIAVFGFSRVNGAHSWIHFAGLTMEPSEFAKLALIISVAAQMAKVDEDETAHSRVKTFWIMVVTLIVPMGLTYKEPALGQSLIMFVTVLTMFIVFAKRSVFVALTAIFMFAVSGLSYMIWQMPHRLIKGIDFLVKHHILKSFQVDRIITWINPNYDLSGSGYEIYHAQIAVGSGGLFGEGLFNGILTNHPGGIPNQTTDYIFTAIGEEFGFIGSTLLIILFLLLIQRIVRAASVSRDSFGTYILIGIVGMFGFQVFENIGMNMYLSPSTGITLPFISYGGTSVVADYIAVGLAISVAIRSKALRFTGE